MDSELAVVSAILEPSPYSKYLGETSCEFLDHFGSHGIMYHHISVKHGLLGVFFLDVGVLLLQPDIQLNYWILLNVKVIKFSREFSEKIFKLQ